MNVSLNMLYDENINELNKTKKAHLLIALKRICKISVINPSKLLHYHTLIRIVIRWKWRTPFVHQIAWLYNYRTNLKQSTVMNNSSTKLYILTISLNLLLSPVMMEWAHECCLHSSFCKCKKLEWGIMRQSYRYVTM